MSLGRTFTAAGVLQFDDEMFQPVLRKTGYVNSQAGFFFGTSAIIVTGVGIGEFIAIGGGLGYSVTIDFGNRSDGQRFFTTDAPVGTTFTYFIYRSPAALAVPNPPLFTTLNTAGQVTFTAAYRHMINSTRLVVADSIGYPDFTAAGRQLAACQLSFAGYNRYENVREENPGDWYYDHDLSGYAAIISNSGQTVSTWNVPYDRQPSIGPFSGPPDPANQFEVPATFFVVDVTNVPIGTTFF